MSGKWNKTHIFYIQLKIELNSLFMFISHKFFTKYIKLIPTNHVGFMYFQKNIKFSKYFRTKLNEIIIILR